MNSHLQNIKTNLKKNRDKKWWSWFFLKKSWYDIFSISPTPNLKSPWEATSQQGRRDYRNIKFVLILNCSIKMFATHLSSLTDVLMWGVCHQVSPYKLQSFCRPVWNLPTITHTQSPNTHTHRAEYLPVGQVRTQTYSLIHFFLM